MQSYSTLHSQNSSQSEQSIHSSEPISPLRASVDPRFNRLLIRAADYRERVNKQQVSPINWVHSPSVISVNTNVWSPTEISKEESKNTEKKSWLPTAWKNRLQGLLIGLTVAAISTGITLAILLSRSCTNSTTSTTSTTESTSSCSSWEWDPIGVTACGNGTYGNQPDQLSYPYSVYINSNNSIYVADYDNHRIQQWLPNAVSGTTVAGVTGICGSNDSYLCYPIALYGDSQQNLYISDLYGIKKWPVGASVGSRVPGSSSLGSIYGIFVDREGNLYASIYASCVVRKWTSTSNVSTIVAGGSGCGQSSSQLNYPFGIFVNSVTNLIYISNSNSYTIMSWVVGATTGTIVAGWNSTYGTTNFLLNYPTDVKSDQYDNLYVVDASNSRILLLCQNPSSTSAKIIAGYKLSFPISIAVDSNLNLYVADPNNYRIQKFNRIV